MSEISGVFRDMWEYIKACVEIALYLKKDTKESK